MSLYLLLFASSVIIQFCAGQSFVDLNAGWTIQNTNGSISVSADAPCSAHSALAAHGLIGDPVWGDNEARLRWVAEEPWVFRRSFQSPSSASLTSDAVFVQFESIDTVANISLNGHLVGTVVNQFRRYSFEVTSFLAPEGATNELCIYFQPALAYARALEEAYPYVVPNANFYHNTINSSARPFVRKTASDFGWDWGPAFMPCGLRGNVQLVVSPWGVIDTVAVSQKLVKATQEPHYEDHSHLKDQSGELRASKEYSHAELDIRVTLAGRELDSGIQSQSECKTTPSVEENDEESTAVMRALFEDMEEKSSDWCSGKLKLRIKVEGTNVDRVKVVDLRAHESAVVDFTDTIEQPQLWWPRGHGEQYMYNLTVSAWSCVCQRWTPSPSQEISRRIGLREVELVEEPVEGASGLSFFFRINGRPIPIRGTNLVPLDSFTSPTPASDIRWLLHSVVYANMNMLRVWGGGYYMPEAFYDMCDALGLLVWQEMMFACSMYPRNEAFLSNVRAEVVQQVSRLSSHSSVVLWGGNNENENALAWLRPPNSSKPWNSQMATIDLEKLFVREVRDTVREAEGRFHLPYLDTSPSDGLVSESPYIKRWGNTNSLDRRDIHFYDYGCDCENSSSFPNARFVSEFGFQSLPSFNTLATGALPEDLHLNSEWLNSRQRHENGTRQMLEQIQRHYALDKFRVNDTDYLDYLCYLTMLQQARCYETAVHGWRASRGKAPGYNMGVMYWQLNDVWQAPSWSSVEHGGRWKMLHYFARRFFSPVLLLVEEHTRAQQGRAINLQLVNDEADRLQGVVEWSIRDWEGNMLRQGEEDFEVDTLETTTVVSLDPSSLEVGSMLLACIQGANSRHVHLLQRLKTIVVHKPVIEVVKIRPVQSPSSSQNWPGISLAHATNIVLRTDRVAFYVWLEMFPFAGHFNDNGIIMLPGEETSLLFYSEVPITAEDVRECLRIKSYHN